MLFKLNRFYLIGFSAAANSNTLFVALHLHIISFNFILFDELNGLVSIAKIAVVAHQFLLNS